MCCKMTMQCGMCYLLFVNSGVGYPKGKKERSRPCNLTRQSNLAWPCRLLDSWTTDGFVGECRRILRAVQFDGWRKLYEVVSNRSQCQRYLKGGFPCH